MKAVESADGFVDCCVLQEDLGENHADPQGMYVSESGKGREIGHFGFFFPVGRQMECHGVLGVMPE